MHRIIVKNFGPLEDIDLEIKDFMVFIGPNATGKSTLAKLIYAFQKLPEVIEICKNDLNSKSTKMGIDEFFNSFFEMLYLNFFFKTDFQIIFSYDTNLYFILSPNLNKNSKNLYSISVNFSNPKKKTTEIESTLLKKRVEDFNNLSTFIYHVDKNKIFEIFGIKKEKVVFISEVKIPKSIDVATNTYETIILESKKILLNKPDFYLDQFSKIHHILGGEPIINKNGEIGLLLNKNNIFINFEQLSSSQKENFWFLICLSFLRKTEDSLNLIIEEPEIHLFPQSQKDLINYLIEFYNSQNLKLLITTHSHYIIGMINVLINAHRIGQKHPEKVAKVIPKELWLDKEKVFVGRLNDGKLKTVYSEEAEIYDHEELTQTSGVLNEEYGQLLEIDYDENK